MIRKFNDAGKHSEQRRVFNESELKRLAAAVINENVGDLTHFQNLSRRRFDRNFLVTAWDGSQFIAHIFLSGNPT